VAEHVKGALKDELARAARDIADGTLSEEEIRQLQSDMKKRAHNLAVEAVQQHRVRTQVKRAQVSVKQWYATDVSPTLMRNIYYETFRLPHKGAIWHHAYSGMYFGQRGKNYNWSQLRALQLLGGKTRGLAQLASGSQGWGDHLRELPGWPKPNYALAEQLERILKRYYELEPSWRAFVEGGAEPVTHLRRQRVTHQHQTDGIVREFYPHRAREMTALVGAASAAWTKALAACADYRAKAGDGMTGPGLAKAHAAAIASIKDLTKALGALVRIDERDARTVNAIVRTQLLAGRDRDEMYTRLVETLVKGLSPLIEEFAIGQFEDGIIKWDRSAAEAMEEFPKMIVPLLRRDIQTKLFPRKTFYKLIYHATYPDRSYVSKVTEERRNWPSRDDLAADAKILAGILNRRSELKAFAGKRREILREHFRTGIDNVAEEILSRVLSEGLMFRDLDAFVEGVDFADKVQEKLDARKRALEGRGQDLARLTKDGVPDTSAAQYALLWGGSRGHGANLEPVQTDMSPATFGGVPTRAMLRGRSPVLPPAPAAWGFARQVEAREIAPDFSPPSPRFEAIPFIARFPALDGKLGDLAKCRPLVLRGGRGEPIMLYAAWNYQGLFFYYEVRQPRERFFWPVMTQAVFGRRYWNSPDPRSKGVGWAYQGDYCRLLIDTLDARNGNRGEKHTQEFVIFPAGSSNSQECPGVERVVKSQRDAVTKEYRGVKSTLKVFGSQPEASHGPDGTGPYRVAHFTDSGYGVEIFLCRSLFEVPVFAPGWYIAFDCAVAMGSQDGGRRFRGKVWASSGNGSSNDRGGNDPSAWGDLLLLGTDPRMMVQKSEPGYALADSIVSGQSYLLTIVDPDRNVYLSAVDTVLVSAEVRGGDRDVEVFVLKESGENTGVFRGFIDTQPGRGRTVQGVLEVMPGNSVRLGYVDTANARGRRNVIYETVLSVAAPVARVATGPQGEPPSP